LPSLGAQKNFLEFAKWITEAWEKSNANFNEEYFRRAVVKTVIFRSTEALVSDQDWYQGGYRANIVAYTVAKLAATVEAAGKAVDYHDYWSRQAVTPATERQLSVISKQVFTVLTAPPAGIQNVTEWAKKEMCWSRVNQLDIPLSKQVLAELVDEDTDRSRRSEARAEQGAVNRITAQIDVMTLGASYWTTLARWGRTRDLLSPEQIKLLGIAAKMPMMIPTERQSVKLLELKDAMTDEGFQSEA
jgi:hypothetical protein